MAIGPANSYLRALPLLLILLLTAGPVFAGWDDVARIGSGEKVEIEMRDAGPFRGTFISATADSLVMREKSTDRTFARAQIRQVSVYAPDRRIRRGLIWMSVGAGAGAGVGAVACLGCFGEGQGAKYAGPGAAVGAAIGALGFLAAPYKTVYKSK